MPITRNRAWGGLMTLVLVDQERVPDPVLCGAVLEREGSKEIAMRRAREIRQQLLVPDVGPFEIAIHRVRDDRDTGIMRMHVRGRHDLLAPARRLVELLPDDV